MIGFGAFPAPASVFAELRPDRGSGGANNRMGAVFVGFPGRWTYGRGWLGNAIAWMFGMWGGDGNV